MKHFFIYILLLTTFISCKKENSISEAEQSAIEFNGDKNIVGEYKGNLHWSRMNDNGLFINAEANVKKSVFVKYVGENKVEVSFDYPSDFKYKIYEFGLLTKVVDNSNSHIEYVFLGRVQNYVGDIPTSSGLLMINSYKEKREIKFTGEVSFKLIGGQTSKESIGFSNINFVY